MLKKLRLQASPLGQARDLSQMIFNSSHQIWLAGLGAFARAQQEGMKMFDMLVSQGRDVEARTRQVATDTASAARGAAAARAKEVQQIAGGTWDKLEQVFEHRVARALSKLGVHTQNDVQQLVHRLDALSDAVNRLITSGGTRPGAGGDSRAAASRTPVEGSRRGTSGTRKPRKRESARGTNAEAGSGAHKAGGRTVDGKAARKRTATRAATKSAARKGAGSRSPASKSTAAKSTAAKSTAAKSTAAKGAAAKRTPGRSSAAGAEQRESDTAVSIEAAATTAAPMTPTAAAAPAAGAPEAQR